eukprot:8867789-Pyramimonas_sp.AAC.1
MRIPRRGLVRSDCLSARGLGQNGNGHNVRYTIGMLLCYDGMFRIKCARSVRNMSYSLSSQTQRYATYTRACQSVFGYAPVRRNMVPSAM